MAESCREGVDAVRDAILELERAEYVVRTRTYDVRGMVAGYDLLIREGLVKRRFRRALEDYPTCIRPDCGMSQAVQGVFLWFCQAGIREDPHWASIRFEHSQAAPRFRGASVSSIAPSMRNTACRRA